MEIDEIPEVAWGDDEEDVPKWTPAKTMVKAVTGLKKKPASGQTSPKQEEPVGEEMSEEMEVEGGAIESASAVTKDALALIKRSLDQALSVP